MLLCACADSESSVTEGTTATTKDNVQTEAQSTTTSSTALTENDSFDIMSLSYGDKADRLNVTLYLDGYSYVHSFPEDIIQKVTELVEFSDPDNPYLQIPEDYPEDFPEEERYEDPRLTLFYKGDISDGYLLICNQIIAMSQAGGLLETFLVDDENAEWIRIELTEEAREILIWKDKVEVDEESFYIFSGSGIPSHCRIMTIDRKTGEYAITYPYA